MDRENEISYSAVPDTDRSHLTHPVKLRRIYAVSVFASPVGIRANDSTAALAAGGIELLKNEHIAIREEVLEISPVKVRVKYRFFERANRISTPQLLFLYLLSILLAPIWFKWQCLHS